MTPLSSVSASSSTWASAPTPRPGGAGRLAEQLMSKFDTDNSDGVDSSELQSLLEDVAKKTGVSSTSSADDLLSSSDSNGDGSLSGEELAQTLQSILPPPSTLEFAQSRSSRSATGEAGDDLFSRVDSDGSGSVNQSELQALLENMSGNTDSTATSSEAGALFKQLDSDNDGQLSSSEFDAGRPSNQDQSNSSSSTASANRPPPPPGGPGRGASAGDSSSQTYDPLDTNEDGVVSMEERLAASTSEASGSDPLQALFDTLDSNSDGSISNAETDDFVTQLSAQLDRLNSGSEASSSDASDPGDGQSSETAPPAQDLLKLVQAARREYQAHSQAWNTPVNSLSAMA